MSREPAACYYWQDGEWRWEWGGQLWIWASMCQCCGLEATGPCSQPRVLERTADSRKTQDVAGDSRRKVWPSQESTGVAVARLVLQGRELANAAPICEIPKQRAAASTFGTGLAAAVSTAFRLKLPSSCARLAVCDQDCPRSLLAAERFPRGVARRARRTFDWQNGPGGSFVCGRGGRG